MSAPVPTVREDVEPVLTRAGRWECPWPGCPDSRTSCGKDVAIEHARSPHVRCSCGRYFAAATLNNHLGQVRRRGIEHPPAPEVIRDDD